MMIGLYPDQLSKDGFGKRLAEGIRNGVLVAPGVLLTLIQVIRIISFIFELVIRQKLFNLYGNRTISMLVSECIAPHNQ